MNCSIIIVNHNTRDLLRDLLDSFVQHLHDREYEIIVVDNASTDGSDELAAEFAGKLPLRWLKNDRNEGFAAANNRGIMLSQMEFVLLLNSDTLLLDGSLIRFVEQIATMPEVAIAGCRLLNADHSLQRSCGVRPNWKTEMYNKLLLDRFWKIVPAWGSYYLPPEAHNQAQEVAWVTGACMLLRRSVLDRIGLLDQNIYMFYEDIDLCLRARRAGFRVMYSPAAAVVHLHGGSWKKQREKTIINDAWSALYFHHRHSGKLMRVWLRLLIFCQNSLRLLFSVPMSLLANANKNEYLRRMRGYARAMLMAAMPLPTAQRLMQSANAEKSAS